MSSLPFAYSTNGFTQRSLQEAIEIIAGLGYEGVELLGDRPHWTVTEGSRLSTADLKSLLQDLNIKVSNVNGNTAMYFWPEWIPETLFEPSLSHTDPKVRQKRFDAVLALMDWAKELGAPRVSITSGRCPGLEPPEVEMAYLSEQVYQLCQVADQLDLELGIEYEPGLLIESWSELLQLIERVNHPRLGANLDLGHAHCAGEDPLEAIEALAGRIWNVHIEDIKGSKHYHLIPGEGNMPLASYLERLKKLSYTRMVTVELYTYAQKHNNQDIQAAKKALAYLKSL
ncbi:MAG: xylose isomerase [Myxococcales bacterium]|nr:xylose isomerase [Myxococcales bacterium]